MVKSGNLRLSILSVALAALTSACGARRTTASATDTLVEMGPASRDYAILKGVTYVRDAQTPPKRMAVSYCENEANGQITQICRQGSVFLGYDRFVIELQKSFDTAFPEDLKAIASAQATMQSLDESIAAAKGDLATVAAAIDARRAELALLLAPLRARSADDQAKQAPLTARNEFIDEETARIDQRLSGDLSDDDRQLLLGKKALLAEEKAANSQELVRLGNDLTELSAQIAALNADQTLRDLSARADAVNAALAAAGAQRAETVNELAGLNKTRQARVDAALDRIFSLDATVIDLNDSQSKILFAPFRGGAQVATTADCSFSANIWTGPQGGHVFGRYVVPADKIFPNQLNFEFKLRVDDQALNIPWTFRVYEEYSNSTLSKSELSGQESFPVSGIPSSPGQVSDSTQSSTFAAPWPVMKYLTLPGEALTCRRF